MARNFDFIIVGAGSAGCVLANRLSADLNNRVLLVEAGPSDWNPVFRIPIMAGRLFLGSYGNWSYITEPEPHLNGRRIPWPRGRVLGGSSAINGMIYTRGNAADYDGWAQLGLRAWSFERVLPYFKRSEAHLTSADDHHGADGLLPVGKLMSPNPLFAAFVEAGQQAGLPYNDDFNGAAQEGVGRYDYNVKNGERWSSARSFLEPARARRNLKVVTGAQLRRINLDKGRAVGVSIERGQTEDYFAEREVILSCGAVGSPMALMLSGIGNADDLRKLGIAPIVDLKAVGENLQDHLQVVVAHRSLTPDETYDDCRFDRAGARMLQAMVFKSGPFARMPHEGGAFLRSSENVASPDLQIHFVAGGLARIRHPFARPAPVPGRHDGYTFTGSICQLRPESRGRITLASADYRAKPKIEANYLSSEHDRRVMRTAVKLMREIFAQKAFDAHRGAELAPGPNVKTDAEIDAYVAQAASTVFHPVGTCRMGMDEASVVDEELRVRGVSGLRVVDASIMPRLVSSNTHAPTVMIAERAADFILAD
ncbi:MAG TPA: choline dehydrogenase [Alphaproteobacteria bacterium]|nr:choline dehydrogenase [Alphaproteobacteria bacterium]